MLESGHSDRHRDLQGLRAVYWTDEQADKTELNRLTVRERYHRDPVFHTLVDILYHQIDLGQFTPTELREAVVLAAGMWESYYTRSQFIRVPHAQD